MFHHEIAIIHNHPIHYQDLLFDALAARGVDFLVLYSAGASSRRFLPPRNHAYPSFIAQSGPYEAVCRISCARRIWGALDHIRPSCLIVSGWCDGASWAGWLWGRTHNVPMILWAESNAFDRPRHNLKEALKRAYVRPFAAAHVYGRSNLEYLVRLRFPEDRIFTGRALADTAHFRPLPRLHPRPSHKTLLYVGRLAPEKNLDRLLTALAQIRQDPASPRIVLRLVGYGPLERELRGLAARLSISPFVDFCGPASQEALPAIYSAADAIVLPSLSEPWGLVVNEAMSCGLPALVSSRCGCALDLVNPQTGWLFDPADTRQLTAALEEFADAPLTLLSTMGTAARELARRYSVDPCADTVIDSIRAATHSPAADVPAPSCLAPQ